ncbi:hypothetical protein [Nocardia sp. NPDC051463]
MLFWASWTAVDDELSLDAGDDAPEDIGDGFLSGMVPASYR